MEEDSQVKSRDRVSDHGEVFTAEREVKEMCDLVQSEIEKMDSNVLEPACGNGNFLAEILSRRMKLVHDRYGGDSRFEQMALTALGSLYGIDIMADNAQECRNRLYSLWNEGYSADGDDDHVRSFARRILDCNIVCGNALTFHCVDENQNDTSEPIVFSEWEFMPDGKAVERKYSFEKTLDSSYHESRNEAVQLELDLFDSDSCLKDKDGLISCTEHDYLS